VIRILVRHQLDIDASPTERESKASARTPSTDDSHHHLDVGSLPMAAGADTRTATMAFVFCDVVGSTEVFTALGDDRADVVRRELFSGLTAEVSGHHGEVVKTMGDGIMAAFGAPLASEDHADRALAAARAMAGEGIATFNAWLTATGVEADFRMGIGINSGPVLSGSVGSPRRREYAVIGDTTNTASRIEALTKQAERTVLFSQATRDALRETPNDATALGEFEIRGRTASMILWTVDVGAEP
jgi:adenylate cyclase